MMLHFNSRFDYFNIINQQSQLHTITHSHIFI